MNIDFEQIKSVVKSPKHNKDGVTAKFYRLNDSWGFKLYEDNSVRNRCYKVQKLAADRGFAPKVGHRFSVLVGYEMMYGYITELAEVTIKDSVLKRMTEENSPSYVELDNMYWDLDNRSYPLIEFRRLIDEMEEAGFENNDNHWGNYAWMADGTPVAIDFDNVYVRRCKDEE